MKILYYDCFSGISGDMNLGAMIDLGVDKEYLLNQLNSLGLEGWELILEKDQRHGISGTKATVKQTRHEHIHRHLSDIEKIIDESGLKTEDKLLSKKIFAKVALAEAKVHDVPVEKIHFHEVGAVDSIIDIVGAAICHNFLDVDEVHVSNVELGGGTVKCAHGCLPVPAPATAEIIRGMVVSKDGVDFEATTPTGAAIVAALGDSYGMPISMKIERCGYGIGQKDHPDRPNILRLFLGESEKPSSGHDAVLMECNIDDMNPEWYGYVSELLFEAGASDVYCSNIMMKKGRPSTLLSVICPLEKEKSLKEILFVETTTLGIRVFPFKKETLTRKFEKVDTPLGSVTIKRSFLGDRLVTEKPEYEDCGKIAKEKGLPLKTVYDKILSYIKR
ncbi:MAG TPA: nickel pincer cofactor biosynthesis protein LarC [Bacteroidetes bacterium]|nr:nickel pincer cofactor biosynthesis protein LarC [Bacteroidota bacterium]